MAIAVKEPTGNRTARIPSSWSVGKGLDWLAWGAVRLVMYMVKHGRQDPPRGAVFAFAMVPTYYLFADFYLAFAPYAWGVYNWWNGRGFMTQAVAAPFLHGVLYPGFVGVALILAVAPALAFDRYRHWRETEYLKKHPPPPPVEPDPSKLVLGMECDRVWTPDENKYKILPTRRLYSLDWSNLTLGLFMIAPTGGGKTTFLLQAIEYCRRNDVSFVVMDLKGDGFRPELFDYNFDLGDPASGRQFNITLSKSPMEAGENLGEALVPDLNTGQWYFTATAKNILTDLILCHYRAYDEVPQLKTIQSYLRSDETRKRLLRVLVEKGIDPEGEEKEAMDRLREQAAKKNGDPFGTLDAAVHPFSRGAARDLIVTTGGMNMDELLCEPTGTRFGLAFHKHNLLSTMVGRLVLSLFVNSVLSTENTRNNRRMIIIDEAAPFITPMLAEGMSMVRYKSGSIVMAMQETHRILDVPLRERVLSLPGTKIAGGAIGEQDSDKMSRLFGGIEHDYMNESAGKSDGNSINNSKAGMVGGARWGKAGSVTETSGKMQLARVRSNFMPSEIRLQPRHHAIIEARSTTGEIRPATMIDMDLKHVEPSLLIQTSRSNITKLNRLGPLPELRNTSLRDYRTPGGFDGDIEEQPNGDTAPEAGTPTKLPYSPPLYTLSDKTSPGSQLQPPPEPGEIDENLFKPQSQRPANDENDGTGAETAHQLDEPTLTPPTQSNEQLEKDTVTQKTSLDGEKQAPNPSSKKPSVGGTTRGPKRGYEQGRLIQDDATRQPPVSGDDGAGAYPDWVGQYAQLVASRFTGLMDESTALHLCSEAYRSGRDADYIKKMLTYVFSNPEIDKPVAKFTSMIRQHKESPTVEQDQK